MNKKYLYSVVVPVYNSSKTLSILTKQIADFFLSKSFSFEIIFVNDFSQDDSLNILKELKKDAPFPIKILSLAFNSGQHRALQAGFQYADGEFILTIDDDLQYTPFDFSLLIEKQKELNSQLVYGITTAKQHSFVRNLGSKIIAWIFRKFANTPGKGSSFKLIHYKVIDQIKQNQNPYIYIDELLAWHSSIIDFVEVNHYPRMAGKSGYSFLRLVIYSLQIILTYTTLPLKIISWVGLLSFLISSFIISYFIYMKFQYGSELGFTALIVSIFMSSGLLLFSIGVIGEYLSRIFTIQSARPTFLIKEQII